MAARAHGLRSRSQETSAGTGKAATARKRLRPPRLLTYVDAVARHGSIRKAADALSVASSALNRKSWTSKQIWERRCLNACRAASA